MLQKGCGCDVKGEWGSVGGKGGRRMWKGRGIRRARVNKREGIDRRASEEGRGEEKKKKKKEDQEARGWFLYPPEKAGEGGGWSE